MGGENALLRERRIANRMLARGEQGLAEMLLRLKGVVFGGRYRFESLLAVGGEGAVFLVRDLEGGPVAGLVGKVPLHPVHRSFDLTADGVRERRRSMRTEAVLLESNDSPWMPASVGTFQFQNLALPVKRGGAFAEAEPVLLMERLPGIDLDRWLARVHDSGVRPDDLRPVLDRVALELLAAISDLRARGYHYADLRPGNVRLLSRPERHMRLLDAGSLVPAASPDGRFPHVPAYLPPRVFEAFQRGEPVVPDDATIAVMAGRTLYEIATGQRAFPGEDADVSLLADAPVSPGVAEVVALLCAGEFPDVRSSSDHVADKFGVAATPAPVSRPHVRKKKERPKATLEEVERAHAIAASPRPAPVPPSPAAPSWAPAPFDAAEAGGLAAAPARAGRRSTSSVVLEDPPRAAPAAAEPAPRRPGGAPPRPVRPTTDDRPEAAPPPPAAVVRKAAARTSWWSRLLRAIGLGR